MPELDTDYIVTWGLISHPKRSWSYFVCKRSMSVLIVVLSDLLAFVGGGNVP